MKRGTAEKENSRRGTERHRSDSRRSERRRSAVDRTYTTICEVKNNVQTKTREDNLQILQVFNRPEFE